MLNFVELNESECYELEGGVALTAAAVWGVVKVVGACFGKGLATGAGIWVSKKVLDTIFE